MSKPEATEIIPASAPDIIQKGSLFNNHAPMTPPHIPINILKDRADRFIGVP